MKKFTSTDKASKLSATDLNKKKKPFPSFGNKKDHKSNFPKGLTGYSSK